MVCSRRGAAVELGPLGPGGSRGGYIRSPRSGQSRGKFGRYDMSARGGACFRAAGADRMAGDGKGYEREGEVFEVKKGTED